MLLISSRSLDALRFAVRRNQTRHLPPHQSKSKEKNLDCDLGKIREEEEGREARGRKAAQSQRIQQQLPGCQTPGKTTAAQVTSCQKQQLHRPGQVSMLFMSSWAGGCITLTSAHTCPDLSPRLQHHLAASSAGRHCLFDCQLSVRSQTDYTVSTEFAP